ncbi:MAG: hypothetical protein AAFX78_04885 [Cyanobacteria bacterium J06638_20]
MADKHSKDIQFYKGDDLFSVAWIGPTFSSDDENYTAKMTALKRVFQGHNVLGELVENWKDGLISEPFHWYLKDSTGDRAEDTGEAEATLQRWIDWVEQQYLQLDPKATNFQQSDPWSEFVLSVGVCGEGNLRLYQPERFEDAADPIQRYHLHAPKAGSVKVDRGRDGFIDKISYATNEENQIQEWITSEVLRISNGSDDDPNAKEVTTGGRWLIQHIKMPSLMTESAKQKQSAICHALTMMVRNQETAGFRERVLLNGDLPANVERGPGIDLVVPGFMQGEPGGRETLTNPSVHESQPVPVDTFEQAIALNRTLLYLEYKQGHLLSTSDGTLSGESRIQARQGFELFLRGWKRPIESAIANTLNVVLRLLGYEQYEAVVELRISTGKLSAEERQEIRSDYEAGLLSRASAIALSGLSDDPDAEMALIEEEREAESRRREPVNPLGIDPPEGGDDDSGKD